MNVGALWDSLVLAVCRPPRDDQYGDAALVGGRRATFKLLQGKYYRQDLVLVSGAGQCVIVQAWSGNGSSLEAGVGGPSTTAEDLVLVPEACRAERKMSA